MTPEGVGRVSCLVAHDKRKSSVFLAVVSPRLLFVFFLFRWWKGMMAGARRCACWGDLCRAEVLTRGSRKRESRRHPPWLYFSRHEVITRGCFQGFSPLRFSVPLFALVLIPAIVHSSTITCILDAARITCSFENTSYINGRLCMRFAGQTTRRIVRGDRRNVAAPGVQGIHGVHGAPEAPEGVRARY